MLRIDPAQASRIAQQRFVQKLQSGLCRAVPAFAALPPQAQLQCLAESLDAGLTCGLRSEQALASYALASAFIGPGFESVSPALQAVLAGPLPEARRVHALNAWALGAAGAPGRVGVADAALDLALQRTAALGHR